MPVMDRNIHDSFCVIEDVAFFEREGSSMWEVIKEFIGAVMSGVAKEMGKAGGGAVVAFICMLAFLFIVAGIFIESRCALLYFVTAEGKRKLIGSLYVQTEDGNYKVKIPEAYFDKSESIYYYVHLPEDFAHRHYMEEMLIETPHGKRRLAIKKQMQFKSGLG